jgi:hypothetical protein
MIPTVSMNPSRGGDLRKTREVGWKETRLVLAYKPGVAEPLFGVTTANTPC